MQMKRIKPLDSRQLQAFEELCSNGSFTETAKRLFLTQSAVSHSMKSLEKELGCQLLRRQGKKISLTEAGERLLRFTRPFLLEMERLRQEMRSFEKFGAGRIRLGAGDRACRYILPTILEEFKEKFPQCRFEIKTGDTPKCLQLLTLGEIDLAITLEPMRTTDIDFVPCFTDELLMVVPVDHPWAVSGQIDWNMMDAENLLIYNRDSYTFRILKDFFDKKRMKLSSFTEIDDSEATKALIKAGMGVGVLANWTVERECKEKKLISLGLGRKKLHRTWGISVRKGRKLNKAERIFIKVAEESGCRWMVGQSIGV